MSGLCKLLGLEDITKLIESRNENDLESEKGEKLKQYLIYTMKKHILEVNCLRWMSVQG